MAKNGNLAPSCKWWPANFRHTIRQRLYVNGAETPFFIDSAQVAAHKRGPEKHGLYGSGMSAGGFAELIAEGRRIDALKHRAEQLALAA